MGGLSWIPDILENGQSGGQMFIFDDCHAENLYGKFSNKTSRMVISILRAHSAIVLNHRKAFYTYYRLCHAVSNHIEIAGYGYPCASCLD